MITITDQLMQQLVNYLARRPYVEVWQLIRELQIAAEAKNKKIDG